MPRPPRFAEWLVQRLLHGDAREIIAGDLEEAHARRIAAGVTPREAAAAYRREAAASVGSVYRARLREMFPGGGLRMRPGLFQGLALDARYVLRGLAASRGFTAIAILSLAIGIGATTALANVARTLLVTELPVDRPDQLSWIFWKSDVKLRSINFGNFGMNAGGEYYESNFSFPLYRAVQAAAPAGTSIAGFNIVPRLNVARPGQPPSVATGLIVSGEFFRVLRLPVARGRPIVESDDRDDAPPVVILTDAFWRRTYGGSADAIGSVLAIYGQPFEIIGIADPAFDGLSRSGLEPPTDVIVPFAAQPIIAPSWQGEGMPLREDFTRQWVRVLARVENADPAPLRAAATTALATTLTAVVSDAAALRTIAVRFWPANRGLDSLNATTARPLAILSAVVGIFLLVTCINLAGMLTARGLARQRDLAVRRALGAERWRLIRQAMVESVVLAAAGGAAGILLAAWTGSTLATMLADGFRANDIRLQADWMLIAIACGVTLTTALVFGIVPAIRMTKIDATAQLRNRGSGSRRRSGAVLIALQLAVTVPLIVGATLFLRTLGNLSSVDVGFDPQGLVIFEINPVRRLSPFDTTARPSSAEADRMQAVLARLESIPGVSSGTVMENALLTGRSSNTTAEVDGKPARMQMQAVGPRFFETMRMRLVAGRPISETDVAGRPDVAVINETAARRYFPGGSAIGRTFTVGAFARGFRRTVEVVGVVADARYESLRSQTAPTFYDSYLQRPSGTYSTFFALRTSVAPATLERAVREAVASVDPSLPIVRLETQQQKIDRAIGRERVLSRLLTIFGGFALLLASLGLHGLTSYSVARRTGEIGIRLALGAQRSQVLWMILRQVLVLAGAGLTLGLPLAWAGSPLLSSYLFGVPPRDVATIVVAALVLTAVALLAGWLPARRAARMDPLGALRVE